MVLEIKKIFLIINMVKKINQKIVLVVFIVIFLFLIRKQDKQENFIDGNFSLCEKNDCECLKMKRAPDGTCIDYKLAGVPITPGYKDKKLFMKHVVRNNLYPLKRNLDILIFVGRGMKGNIKRFKSGTPSILGGLQRLEKEKHSIHPKTQNIYEVFQKAMRILKYFDKEDKPYMKYLVCDIDHGGESREIMNSYNLTTKIAPMIYLINEVTNEKKYFKFDTDEDKCYLLKELLIFISNGDLGLISYLNHLHDPFCGVEFLHDSVKNKWYRKNPGMKIHEEGTEMCKLIDYRDLPEDMFKDSMKLENKMP